MRFYSGSVIIAKNGQEKTVLVDLSAVNDLKRPKASAPPKLYPKELSIVKVIAPFKNKRGLVKAVESIANVEPIEVDPRLGVDHLEIEKRRNKLEAFRNEITSLLGQLDSSLIAKSSKLKIPYSEVEIIEFVTNNLTELSGELKEHLDKRTSLKNRLAELESLQTILEQLSTLELDKLDFSISGSQYTKITLGTVFGERFQTMNFDLRESTDDKSILISSDYTDEEKMFLLIYLQKDHELVSQKLRDSQYTPVEIPMKGSLSIEEVRKELKRVSESIKNVEEKIEKFSSAKGKIFKGLLEVVTIELDRINNIELKMKRTKTQTIMWAWIPPREQENFKKLVLSETENNAQIEFKSGEFDPKLIPSYTPNPKVFNPIRGLVSSFGTPSSKEVDPFPFVAIFFPVFFGIMFADVMHGLILTFVGLYFVRKKKVLDVYPTTGITGYLYTGANLLVIMGIVSTVFGLLLGSFFGDETILWQVPFLVNLFGATTDGTTITPGIFPIWTYFYTLHPTMYHGHATFEISRNYANFLVFSFAIGGLTILLGLFIQIYQKLNFRNKNSELYAAIALPVIYVSGFAGISAFLLNNSTVTIIFMLLTVASVVFLLVLEKKSHGTDGMMLAVDHTLALLSNTFSFGRLLALNTIHFVFAFLPYLFINMFIKTLTSDYEIVNHHTGLWAETIGPLWYVWILAAILGSLIVVPIETIFSTLQALRLNWVEFFGKFYIGTGVPFQPVVVQREFTVENVGGS